jgi:hypothetical protein
MFRWSDISENVLRQLQIIQIQHTYVISSQKNNITFQSYPFKTFLLKKSGFLGIYKNILKKFHCAYQLVCFSVHQIHCSFLFWIVTVILSVRSRSFSVPRNRPNNRSPLPLKGSLKRQRERSGPPSDPRGPPPSPPPAARKSLKSKRKGSGDKVSCLSWSCFLCGRVVYRMRRVTWLQTATVFWLGGGIISPSCWIYRGLMMVDRLK